MKEALIVMMPLLLVLACCTLLAMEQAGHGFVFLGLSNGTWGTLAGLGAIVSFASLFFWGRAE